MLLEVGNLQVHRQSVIAPKGDLGQWFISTAPSHLREHERERDQEHDRGGKNNSAGRRILFEVFYMESPGKS
jgi:hypothetical protein